MALAVDATTPALVTGFTSSVTASFTAPADSLLVALAAITSGLGTRSISNTGGALTWTSRKIQNHGLIWTAPAPVSVARTVTIQTTDGIARSALKLLVVTGADLAAPFGASGSGTSSTQNLTANVYTSTVAGSLAVGIGIDDNGAATPTSSDVGFGFTTPDFSGVAVYKAATTPTVATGETLNFNGTGAARSWDWAAVEILPTVVPFLAKRGLMLGQAVNRAANF